MISKENPVAETTNKLELAALRACIEEQKNLPLSKLEEAWGETHLTKTPSHEIFMQGRRMAMQSQLLRLMSSTLQEGFVPSAHKDSPVFSIVLQNSADKNPDNYAEFSSKNSISITNYTDALRFMYNRDISQQFTLYYHGDKNSGPIPVPDISIFHTKILAPNIQQALQKALSKDANIFSDRHWHIFLMESYNSLNNCTLAMVKRIELFNELQRASKEKKNFWTWMVAEKGGLADWVKEKNAGKNDSLTLITEDIVKSMMASSLGHPMHFGANVRTKVMSGMETSGNILPFNGKSPIMAVSQKEVIQNSGAFGQMTPEPVMAVHTSKMVMRWDNPESGQVEEMSPDKYKEYFKKQYSDTYNAWEKWIAAKGKNLDEYIPLVAMQANIERILELFKEWKEDQDIIIPKADEGAHLPLVASLSTRTKFTSPTSDHIKLPVSWVITSAFRILPPSRVYNSPVLAHMLNDIVVKDNDINKSTRIVSEGVGVTIRETLNEKIDMKFHKKGYDLGCIFRTNPGKYIKEDEKLLEVSLVFERSPTSGKPMIVDIMHHNGVYDDIGAEEYFRNYCNIVIGGHLGLLARYGIALEGHQQNTLLAFEKNGRLRSTVNRDICDGAFMDEDSLKAAGYDIAGQLHPVRKTLCDTIAIPTKQLLHTTLLQHIVPIANIVSTNFNIKQDKLIDIVQKSISDTLQSAREFHKKTQLDSSILKTSLSKIDDIEKTLGEREILHKPLLMMRLMQTYSSPKVFTANPLFAYSRQASVGDRR